VTTAGPVFVVAAGGKTGRAVTGALVARGVPVRRADVDLVTGRGLEEALDGVRAVYHLAPNVHPDEVGIARRVVAAAGRAGVERLVFHSVLHPHDSAMPHHLRKADAEEVVRAGLPAWTVLQPAAYQQNLLAAALAGRIAVPYSLDAPFTNVDLEDVAEVAGRVLTEPGHERATYELAGPELTSVRGLAAVAADVLGRPVTAREVSQQDWAAGPGAALPAQARADLMAMFAAYDGAGLAGNPRALAMLLGRPPTPWRDVLGRGW
jgi:NAD(P)H dehydrogenase (quinone)